MPQRPYVIDQMISAKTIAARIEDLCREIETEFKDTNKLVVVGLLRGSFVFIADLVRELDLPIEVDFLEASSYGDSMESSREVRILKDLRGAIEGRDVLVVEDIVDTGHTMHHVTGLLSARKPAKLRTIALLDKPSRREVDFKANWTGFDIPDAFVVGYAILHTSARSASLTDKRTAVVRLAARALAAKFLQPCGPKPRKVVAGMIR